MKQIVQLSALYKAEDQADLVAELVVAKEANDVWVSTFAMNADLALQRRHGY